MPLLEIGYIAKPHGLRGEVVVELLTNRLERLEPGTRLVVRPRSPQAHGSTGAPGSTGTMATDVVVVASARPHQRRFLVTFEGVGNRDAAEALRGATLVAEALADPDALFVHELIGAEVVEVSGRTRGLVVAVEANPASDLLVLEGGALVPLAFVVALEHHRVVIDPPEGLLE